MSNTKIKSVYVASHDYTTLTKVGISVDAAKRMDTIKGAVGAKMTVFYESPLLENAIEIECDILAQFVEFRVSGEWLNIEPEKIINYINTIENKFNTADFKCLTEGYREDTEIIVNQFVTYRINRELQSAYNFIFSEDYVYVTKDFKFTVFYQQRDKIKGVVFNVYKTARTFVSNNRKRLVNMDETFTEFIPNQNFKIQ